MGENQNDNIDILNNSYNIISTKYNKSSTIKRLNIEDTNNYINSNNMTSNGENNMNLMCNKKIGNGGMVQEDNSQNSNTLHSQNTSDVNGQAQQFPWSKLWQSNVFQKN